MSYQNNSAEYYNQASTAGASATGPSSFDGYTTQEPAAFDIGGITLPAPNMACYQEPPQPRPEVKYLKVEETPVTKTITQNFNTAKTVVKENVVHHSHVKNVIINVNRNHWHTQRVVVKDNNYHHYLINNLIKVADIHHQKIEQVRGESKSFNDYKQTQRVEAAECQRGNDQAGFAAQGAASSSTSQSSAAYSAGSASQSLTNADEVAINQLIAGANSSSSIGRQY